MYNTSSFFAFMSLNYREVLRSDNQSSDRLFLPEHNDGIISMAGILRRLLGAVVLGGFLYNAATYNIDDPVIDKPQAGDTTSVVDPCRSVVKYSDNPDGDISNTDVPLIHEVPIVDCTHSKIAISIPSAPQ